MSVPLNSPTLKPTNITLLDPKRIVPGLIKEVTSSDAFEGMTQNLNDEGLYSLAIFGKLGSPERDKTEAFINVGLPIFNPTYLKALIQLKGLYQGILKGAEYAVWDPTLKDFIKSNLLEGETGFSFFIRHFEEIVYKESDSYKRKQRITLVDRFKGIALTDKVLVIPAGLRDIQFQPNGAPLEPEITELYRKLMFRTRVISSQASKDPNNPLYDNVRWGIQNAFVELDQFLFQLSEGKGGLFQRRMSTRGVVSGTRNVITARKVSRNNLFDYNGVNPNSTDMGLYQALLNFQYVCIHALLNKYLMEHFTQGSSSAKLVNPKTLEYEYHDLTPEQVEKWTTPTGLSKLINGFSNVNHRNKPIRINNAYLALVYDDGKDICVLSDINELPEGKDRRLVTPMTYAQLFYLSCHETILEQMAQQTRYPVTGIGSTLPVEINLLTTSAAKPRVIRDLEWNEIGKCARYPATEDSPDYFDAMSVDPSREDGLGSDHDGDGPFH